MLQALAQAEQSAGLASPNPAVGCVLVKDGVVVGAGFHAYEEKDHAEVVALRQAGDAARGATAYVTLEPCCITGRTGPCTRALIAAGVARVVAATLDPNPAVHGKGAEELRKAGIAVDAGVLEAEARRVNDGFARHIQSGLPFVTLKAAVSLDGRIAPPPGSVPRGAPLYLTGEAARAEVQRMRHRVDAVVTGINTVLEDDPLLTDRTGLPRRRKLLRVVLDSGLRIRLDAKLVRTAEDDVLVFCTVAATEHQRTLEAMGVRVERVEPDTTGKTGARGVCLGQVFRRLGEMGMTTVLLEGGGQLNASALRGGHVDRLSLFYAPMFLGPGAVPLLREAVAGLRWEAVPAVKKFGQDVLVEATLRNPWEES